MKLTEPQRQHLHDLAICSDRPQPETPALVKHGLAEQGKGKFGEWARITQKGIDLTRKAPLAERIKREGTSISKTLSEPARIRVAATTPGQRDILGGSASPVRRTAEKQADFCSAITSSAQTLKVKTTSSMPPAPQLRGAKPPKRDSGKQAAPVMPAASRSTRVAPSPAPLHPPRGSATATRAKQPAPPSAAAPSPKRTPPGPRVASKAAADPKVATKNSLVRDPVESDSPASGKIRRPSGKYERTASSQPTPRPAAKPKAGNSTGHLSPNAIRVQVGNKFVYYSLSMESKLNGPKCRVTTTAKLNRAYAMASPESQQDVLH